ncbi:cytosine permease [Bacillus velezensis]
MMADYFIIRKRQLSVEDLYSETGQYTYYKGYNYRAFAATFLGAFISLIGMYVPAFAGIYDISWFAGVILSCLGYTALMYIHPPYAKAEGRIVRERAAE